MNPLTTSEAEAEDTIAGVLSTISKSAKALPIRLSRDWAGQNVPDTPGVYVVFEGGDLVYVGESGSLRSRMIDLLDSRHHQLRRNIGRKLFERHPRFKDANSRTKFPPLIEQLLQDHIERNLRVTFYPVYLGRKEIEEKLFAARHPKYNIKGRRS